MMFINGKLNFIDVITAIQELMMILMEIFTINFYNAGPKIIYPTSEDFDNFTATQFSKIISTHKIEIIVYENSKNTNCKAIIKLQNYR